MTHISIRLVIRIAKNEQFQISNCGLIMDLRMENFTCKIFEVYLSGRFPKNNETFIKDVNKVPQIMLTIS